MPNTKFDAKSFNPQAFKYAVDRIPRTRLNEMRKSRALAGNPDIREVFSTQGGTGYARIAMRGLLDGDAVNYDGQTNITATSTKTFEQGVVVIGRAKAWVEKDFSFDITGGVDFMNNVAQQVADYWQDIDQDTILAVLKGVFSMTGGKSGEFVTKHTYSVNGNLEASTLNSATAQACGDRKKKFSLVFMHSVVATNLENLNLLTALKYTNEHEWVALAGDVATVGITDYAADKLGDVVFVDLPSVGSSVTAGEVCGEIESTKSVGELYAPLTGEVVEVNDAVIDDPASVNGGAFDAWLIKIQVDPADVEALLDRAAYVALTGGEA